MRLVEPKTTVNMLTNLEQEKSQSEAKRKDALAAPTGSARDWSKDFNALPDEVRLIGCAMEARTRIQMLEMEKDRLKKSYRRNIGEIDAYIENCRVWLHKLEAPNDKVEQPAPTQNDDR